jgi:hypothetical protein
VGVAITSAYYRALICVKADRTVARDNRPIVRTLSTIQIAPGCALHARQARCGSHGGGRRPLAG